MFRKFALALGTTVAIGTAALIPTSASAHGYHGHWHGGFGWGVRHLCATLCVQP